ncbi:MAG: hypothetical protein JKY88_03830, partial [Pseudomonadales bacterium]|nr:hypothetical protein [Pseudomonadales bacterium]
MNQRLQILLIASLILTLPITSQSAEKDEHAHEHEIKEQVEHGEHDDDDDEGEHDDEQGEHDDEGAGIKLSNKQLNLAEIETSVLQYQVMTYSIYAQGEIKANDYTSYLVSPRVDSVVLKRHVALGDHIEIN